MPQPPGAILILDDDVALSRAYAQLLERDGFAVVAVHSGIEGLAALSDRSFQAILCDLRLPFLEGKSFYKELTDLYPEQAKRVVFITGYPPDRTTHNFLADTGRPVLHKPVEFADLIAAVRRVVEQA
jgi:DNA-binding response OmpR family regulator